MRNGEVPLSRNPRIPGPSDVEARVSYPLAAFATHKKRGRVERKQRLCQESPAPPKEVIVSYPLAAFVTHKKRGRRMGGGRPPEAPRCV